MTIPAAAGIGDVVGLIEVDVETGSGQDARLLVIVFFPDFPVIEGGHGAAIHGDGIYRS